LISNGKENIIVKTGSGQEFSSIRGLISTSSLVTM